MQTRQNTNKYPHAYAGLVHIFDRNGAQEEELALNSPDKCLTLDWSRDGEVCISCCSEEGREQSTHTRCRLLFCYL